MSGSSVASQDPSIPDPVPIDVAVVNWNTADAAVRAARCFLSSDRVEARVTIVDNGSEEDERSRLNADVPADVRLVANEENVGYGRAANAALRGGTAPLVCVSNADLAFDRAQLSRLAAAALSDRGSGMVGPRFEGGTDHYHSSLPGPGRLMGQAFAGRLGRRGTALPGSGEVATVGQVSGACFVMRRETWDHVGGFDEGFFLWYDDVDLARRLTDLGYRNLVVGAAVVTHTGAASFAQLDRRRAQTIRLDSLERYLLKHHPRSGRATRSALAAARRLRAR